MAQDSFGNYQAGLNSAGATLQFAGSGGTGSGITQVFDAGGASPEGAVEAQGPALAFDDNGGLYSKKDTGSSSTSGWKALINPEA